MLHVPANFRKEYKYFTSTKCKVNIQSHFLFFDDKEGEICPAFPAGCRKGLVRIDKDGCPVCDSKGIFSEQYVNIKWFQEAYTISLICDFKNTSSVQIVDKHIDSNLYRYMKLYFSFTFRSEPGLVQYNLGQLLIM